MMAAREELREALAAHIEAVEGVPVEWGATDCTMWPARWWARCGRTIKPLPVYSSEAEAREHIERAGSLEALWSWALECVPERYGDPAFGDVGIIASHRFGQVGGIFGDDGTFFWRASKGVALLRPRAKTIIRIWACSSE